MAMLLTTRSKLSSGSGMASMSPVFKSQSQVGEDLCPDAEFPAPRGVQVHPKPGEQKESLAGRVVAVVAPALQQLRR
jgi:hypothetical protein